MNDLYIIVPHYKEGEEVYSPLFTSINNQEGIDFNHLYLVIGQSSLEATFPDVSKWDNLKNRTTFIFKKFEKECAGASREGALTWVKNNSNNPDDYLIFCDCDDDFCNSQSLSSIIKDVDEHKGMDTIQYTIDYKKVENKSQYYGKGKTDDIYAIWNCVYRIDFLKRYDIHSPTNILTMEDIYFRICCRSIASAYMLKIDRPYYVYNNTNPPHGAGITMNYGQSLAELLTLVDNYNAWNPKDVVKNKVWFYKWVMNYIWIHLGIAQLNLCDYDICVPEMKYKERVLAIIEDYRKEYDKEMERLKQEEWEWSLENWVLNELNKANRLK